MHIRVIHDYPNIIVNKIVEERITIQSSNEHGKDSEHEVVVVHFIDFLKKGEIHFVTAS